MELLKAASETAHIEQVDDVDVDGAEDRRREDKVEDVDLSWRLDQPLRSRDGRGKPSELIDDRGKVSPCVMGNFFKTLPIHYRCNN